MIKAVSVLLITIALLSGSFQSFAQSPRTAERSAGTVSVPGSVLAPSTVETSSEFVEFESRDAMTDGNGVLILWRMRAETYNLGFHVYRDSGDGPQLVNALKIPGSAITSIHPTLNGEQYELFDPAGTLGNIYTIRSEALNGRQATSAPIGTRYVKDLEVETGRSSIERLMAEQVRTENSNVQRRDLDLPADLATTVNQNLDQVDLPNHRFVTGQPGVKIGIKNTGVHRVTRIQLAAAGFDVESSSENWMLFLNGIEQAITIGPADEYIEFYGRGIDSLETDTRIYFMIAGTTTGKRITSRILRPVGGNVVSNNYKVTAEKKERMTYISANNGPEENHYGRLITRTVPTPENEIEFNVTGLDTSIPRYVLKVRLQGIQGNAHMVRVLLNGHQVGFVAGVGNTNYSQELLVRSEHFVEGINKLSLAELPCPLPPLPCPGLVNLFDRVTVRYSRKYQAEQDKINFYTPGYRKVELTGFSTPEVRLFDLTLASDPVEITHLNIVENGGTHSVLVPSARPMVMYGFTNADLFEAESVIPNTPSSWSSGTNSADVVFISHSSPEMMAAAETWANYRRSSGLAAEVVDVADVFDEFDYGLPTPRAINEFLTYAHNNWQTAPRYVVLIGDASWDARNYEGFGNWNMVPTQMVNLIFGESGSDEALADLDHDGLAEMAIGRIPARTAAQVTAVMNKTIAFETPAQQSLDRGALFVHDMPIGYDFEAMNISIANQLPMSMPKMFVGRGLPFPNQHTADPQGKANVINAINSGKYIVNYAGHGSQGLWATNAFFWNGDVPSLTNSNNQSIFTMLTCLNGLFFRPQNADSLAETLVNAQNGGAVAAWASTTSTTPNYQLPMAEEFYKEIGLGNIRRMGDLVRDAKLTIPNSDVGYSWALLGDPMLQVRMEQR